MAALERRNPNLDDFVGLNWSCWVVKANILPSDAGSNVEDSSKNGRNRCETMALRREDMHTFGHCPSHDEMYLVVCSHCGQVVKPQAFEKHCERRHGPLTKVCGQSPAPQPRPRSVRPSTNNSCSRERQKDGRCHEAIAPSSAAPPAHQHMPSTAQKEAVSFPSVEKFPQENVPLPHSSPSSTPRPRVPAWHLGPLPPGHCSSSTSPSERPSPQKTTAGQSSEALSPQRGTRTYSRIYKNISKKECDLDKQSRVLDPERKKLCSLELICNTDSIHQQQKALGRSKTLAQLAEEQKPASIEEECDSAVEVEAPPQRAFNQSQLSAEESEDDEKDEDTDLPATPLHPKPLGLCTFGCRTLGCNIFTFNRRLHHLRFALSAMLEHHVSTHLWKKMPQVSSGLRSCQVSSPAVGSAVRTEARSSKSTGSLSLDYTSLGQLETKPSLHKSPSFKSPSSPATATLGPGRRRNPAGKARLREEELMQDASALQKAAMLSSGGEGKSSKCIRDPPLNEKGQPHVPSSQGAVNDTFSNVNKPCPPLQRSPRSKARAPGIQQQGAGCNNRGLAEKRKGSDESTSLSSSLSRTSKCQRLSSPSR
ncbi:Ataxin-7-like protein 2 [Dissostichus eleginoides]|uniref:Ataxin-7-like protein 2 n=1 Tax=Dissostichus eleginoides TaxID=100907 RepID=A0AAD9F9V2_DISEL|nr:Ataxin-7-like protein 2 [Dissostichus eleginoides]